MAVENSSEWLAADSSQRRLDFLAWHGLAALWCRRFAGRSDDPEAPVVVRDFLLSELRSASAMYLAQGSAIQNVVSSFEQANLEFALLKGAAIREEIYVEPATRVATDIDILVRPIDRTLAANILESLGFVCFPDQGLHGHEATFSRGKIHIDMHWDILRPERTRRPLVNSLLANRVRGNPTYRLCDADTIFMMLVHPAFAKYVCSPNMGLNRVIDFVLFARSRIVNWAEVAKRIEESGLRTAAWCTLHWISMLTPITEIVPVSFVMSIRPGAIRRAYLQRWLVHDWPGRMLNRADTLIQIAFTLPLHDMPSDMWRAAIGRVKSTLGRNHSVGHRE